MAVINTATFINTKTGESFEVQTLPYPHYIRANIVQYQVIGKNHLEDNQYSTCEIATFNTPWEAEKCKEDLSILFEEIVIREFTKNIEYGEEVNGEKLDERMEVF
jgi:hypothetical protein